MRHNPSDAQLIANRVNKPALNIAIRRFISYGVITGPDSFPFSAAPAASRRGGRQNDISLAFSRGRVATAIPRFVALEVGTIDSL